MFRLTRSQVQPIGVDLGFDSVKLLQLEVVGETLSVVASAKQALSDEARTLPPEARLATAMDVLRQLLRRANGQFRGRHIVACLPRDIVHVKNLRLPMMPPAEVESAVQFEARNIFPFDTEQAFVRHLSAGEVRQGSDSRLEVIALAARHDEVNNFLEQLHRCGCVVESLDFEPCAIYRSVERFIRRREDENEVNVLVDLGARRTQVIIGRGREINFFKPIEIGAQHLQDAVARKLGITHEEARNLRRRLLEAQPAQASGEQPIHGTSDDRRPEPSAPDDPVRQAVLDATRGTIETLAREVSLCLRYYSVTFRGQRPSKLRVVGGEADHPQLHSILGEVLPIPVEAGRTLYSVSTTRMRPEHRQGSTSDWATAFGAGIKLTREYFGARDGKQRETLMSPPARARMKIDTETQPDTQSSVPDLPHTRSAPPVEVFDLTRAVEGAGAAANAEGHKPSVPREAAHA
jgi:type IV pilus assembly protein PilM